MARFARHKTQKGSALVYILIAIALLAALTVTFMEPSSQQTSSQNTFKTVNTLLRQADFIQSSIQECVLSYPQGDPCVNGTDGIPALDAYCTTLSVTDPGITRDNYPFNPNSDHYVNATPAQSGDFLVRNIRCPGDNGGENANHDDHDLLFGGGTGKFLPPPPDLFGDWEYYHGTDGIYYWIGTDKSDAFLNTALEKADDEFSECQADIIDATGGAVVLDTDGLTSCAAGNVCFRVWVVSNATALYPDPPESTLPCP